MTPVHPPKSPFQAIYQCAYSACGAKFVAYKRHHAAGIHTFCSRSCGAKARVARHDAARTAA